MTRASRIIRLTTLAAAALLLSCAERPTQPVTGAPRPSTLQIHANLFGTTAAALVVEVTAPDFAQPFIFNIPVTGTTATGSISLPAGSSRTITMRAFDSHGIETHRGVRTIDVLEGSNPMVSITLVPLTGEVAIEARLGSLIVLITPSSSVVHAGLRVQLTATVIDSLGIRPDTAVRWATSNPGRAIVINGAVLARDTGNVVIAGTIGGFGGAAEVRVLPGWKVLGMALSQDAIDVSGGPVGVTIQARLTSASAGIRQFNPVFFAPGGGAQQQSCASASPISGTRFDGVWQCTVTIRPEAIGGDWEIALTALDFDGTRVTHTSTELPLIGIPARLSVFGSTPDVSPPTPSQVLFSKDSLDVSAHADTVVIQVRAVTVGVGTSLMSASLANPGGSQTRGCSDPFLDSGTAQDGWWTCRIILPSGSEPGNWDLSAVTLRDSLNNFHSYSRSELLATGAPTTVRVTSAAADVTPPAFMGLTLDRDTVVASGRSDTVRVDIQFSDGGSGLAPPGTGQALAVLESPSGTMTIGCSTTGLLSGSPAAGVMRCTFLVPGALEPGVWHIQRIALLDQVLNTTIMNTMELQTAGQPTSIVVLPPP